MRSLQYSRRSTPRAGSRGSSPAARGPPFATIARHGSLVSPVRIFVAALALSALALLACGSDVASTAQHRARRMPACRDLATAGAMRHARGARRTARKPDGRKIELFVAVLPANTRDAEARSAVHPRGRARAGRVAARALRVAARCELRRTRDVVLIDQRGTGAVVAARRAPRSSRRDARCRSRPIRCRARRLCADELRAKGVDAAQYTTDGVDRRPRSGARRARLPALEPVGRQLRHARRAGISAAPSASACARWCSTASRRPAMIDLARRVAHARSGARRDLRRLRAATPRMQRARIRISRRRSQAIAQRSSGPTGSDDRHRRPAHRRAADACGCTFDVVLGALQPLTYVPETASAAARDARRAPRAATSRRCSRPIAHGDRRPRRADERRAALLGDVRRRRAAHRADDRAKALAGLRARSVSPQQVIAVCDVWPRGRDARRLRTRR